MPAPVSLHPRGTDFARFAIALGRAGRDGILSAGAIARKEWGEHSRVAKVCKALVNPGATNAESDGWGDELAAVQTMQSEFLDSVRPRTIIGRLNALRRVPTNVRVPRRTGSVGVAWTGQGRAKPVGRGAFDTVTMDTTKISGLCVLTNELLRLSGDVAEALVRADLSAAVAELSDASFIDPTATGTPGVSPASVTAGATSIPSTGTTPAALRADLQSAIDAFDGDLESAAWVLHPKLAAAIGLTIPASAFFDLGARGGTLAGLPAIVSRSVPRDSTGSMIALIDASGILLSDDGVMIDVATHASIQMDDTPDGSPTASTVLVNMWATNSVCFRVDRAINWQVGRPGSVVVIEDVSYNPES